MAKMRSEVGNLFDRHPHLGCPPPAARPHVIAFAASPAGRLQLSGYRAVTGWARASAPLQSDFPSQREPTSRRGRNSSTVPCGRGTRVARR